MADFLGERRSRSAAEPTKRRTFDDIRAPQPPKHQARRPEQRRADDLQHFSKDFRKGLDSLNSIVDKLSHVKGTPTAQASASTPTRTHSTTNRTERIVERVQQSPEVKKQARPAQQQLQTPKRQPRATQQQPVARPQRADDKTASLIKVAKAKESARLPFVPAVTKDKAEQKIAELKGNSSKAQPASPKRTVRRSTDRSAAKPEQPKKQSATPAFNATAPNREFMKQSPITEKVAQRVERDIPRFNTQGATIGPAIVEPDETVTNVNNVSVIHRAGSKEAARSELAPNTASSKRDAAAADRRQSTFRIPRTAAAAPASTSRSAPTAAAATGGGGSTPGKTGGNMTVEGTLRLEGMAQGQNNNNEALAQLNARVVRIEGELDG